MWESIVRCAAVSSSALEDFRLPSPAFQIAIEAMRMIWSFSALPLNVGIARLTHRRAL